MERQSLKIVKNKKWCWDIKKKKAAELGPRDRLS